MVLKPPPCDCVECEDQYRLPWQLPVSKYCYRKDLNDSEAASVVATLLTIISSDFEHLRDCCTSHGDVIWQRWRKRSRVKRQQWLLQAVPNLPKGRWDAYHQFCVDVPAEDMESHFWGNQDLLLNPFLTVECLSDDPLTLLNLLYNRVHFTPEEWAPYDIARHQRGWMQGAVRVDYSPLAVVLHGHHYGSLALWDKESAHRWDIVGFPRGKLLLETQAQILNFLRKIIGVVLEDVDLTRPGSCLKWNELGKLAFKAPSGITHRPSHLHQPFCAPPKLDVNKLLDATRARLQASEDQIWLLQTDPLCLQRVFKLNKTNTGIDSSRAETCSNLTLVDIFWDSYTLRAWRLIVEECKTLLGLHETSSNRIHPGQSLPSGYELSLCRLELLLVQFMGATSARLIEFLFHRHAFKDGRSVEKTTSVYTNIKLSVESGEQSLMSDRLFWCLIQLAEGPDKMDSGVDHDVSFAMLEDHLSKCSDKERARLDEKLYELLSDHAAVNEVLTLVRLHRPRAYKDRFGPVRIGRGGLTMMEQGKFFQLIPPEYLVTGVLVERLSMATLSGMRDQKWVEAFDKYQEDSSIFWASFRNVHRNWLEKMHWPIEDIDAEIQYLSANLDPVYLKSVEALRAEVLANLHPKPQSPLRIELQTQWGLEESVEKITIQEKSKIKTRPEAKAPDMTQEVRDGSEDVPAESFVVKKQSHAFFCKLYPPKKTDVVKQASWPEFTSAMASIGFSITHLEGSRVRFDKKDGGKIIFDEPHGKSTKIESEKMYAIKSRLTRRFGFTRDTFILEE